MDTVTKAVRTSGNEMTVSAEDKKLLGEGVVSAQIVSDVFGPAPAPFALDAQGGVSVATYRAWLQVAGASALAAFDDCSEIIGQKPAPLKVVQPTHVVLYLSPFTAEPAYAGA